MSKTFNIQNRRLSGGILQSISRMFVLAVAAIAGIFIFMASAAVAFFVVIGVVLLGLIVFSVLWIRSKILGKPIMPNASIWTSESFKAEFETRDRENRASKNHGPVLDAHKTPEGWSVDTD